MNAAIGFVLLVTGGQPGFVPTPRQSEPLEGRTAMHAPEIDGKVFVNDYPEGNEPKEGEFYRCRITAALVRR